MFLSAKAIAQMASQRKPHFLNASAVRHDQSLGDAVGLKNIGVHLIAVQPGHYSTELHHHLVGEECVYVLSGHGLALIGEQRRPLSPATSSATRLTALRMPCKPRATSRSSASSWE